jgi:SAM-dependent methyltransferase
VYAVDHSPAMLREAARNGRNADVCFLQQDIRCLALPSRVDLITANFDTLNHLQTPADLRRVFRRVAANLHPGGHFYFEMLRPASRRTDTKSLPATTAQPGAGCSSGFAVNRERAYSPLEIGRWLGEAGFKIRGAHDADTLRVATDCPAHHYHRAERRRRL